MKNWPGWIKAPLRIYGIAFLLGRWGLQGTEAWWSWVLVVAWMWGLAERHWRVVEAGSTEIDWPFLLGLLAFGVVLSPFPYALAAGPDPAATSGVLWWILFACAVTLWIWLAPVKRESNEEAAR